MPRRDARHPDTVRMIVARARDRKEREESRLARQARGPRLDASPAVQLYRAEKRLREDPCTAALRAARKAFESFVQTSGSSRPQGSPSITAEDSE